MPTAPLGADNESMADVGELKIRLTFDTARLSNSKKDVESKMSSIGNNSGKLFSNAWSIAAGTMLEKGISKITSSISAAMDKGIARVDTLKNFPKVMTSLGYASDEAEKSIKTVSERLDGLPSATNDVVSNIQMLSATMGNLNQGAVNATSVGLAFNDMILASSGKTEEATNALVQYNQMLATGKVDMQSWNSIVHAAPGQMDQLAKSILGAEANSQQLYDAMKNGIVSFDDLNAAIVDLDKNGGDNFASFEEQARKATAGIGTALDNVQNRIGKAIAKVIEHIGSEKIADAINTISSGFNTVADIVIGIIDFLQENQWIVEFIAIAAATIGVLSAAIWVMNAALYANPITWIVLAIGAAVAAVALLVLHFQEVLNFLSPIGNFFATLWNMLVQFWTGVLNFIMTPIKNFWENVLLPIINFFKNAIIVIVAIIATVIQTIWNIISPIVEWIYNNVIQPIGSFFEGLWNGVTNSVSRFIQSAMDIILPIVSWINENVIQPIGRFFESMWKGVTTAVEAVKNVIQKIFNTIVGIIKAPINGIINGINGVLSMINSITVPDWVPFIGGSHADFGMIPTLAQGGYADGATAAIFGEAGKEAVLPLERNTDNWSGLLARTLAEEMSQQELGTGSGVTIEHMDFNIDNELDARDIGRVMMQSIRRAA